MYSPHGLAVRDSYLYVCEGDAGLKVFKLTNGVNPEVIDHEDGFHAFDIILEDNRAYVTGDDGVRVYDISNPEDLVLLHEEKKIKD